VRAWARAYKQLALTHPGLVLQIVSDPQAVAIAAMHVNEPLVAALKKAGLAPTAVVAAINVSVDYVHGAVLPAAARPTFERGIDIIVAGLGALLSAGTRTDLGQG
jgi:TetR/AcrR family transcriptional regulator, tetracycline repressor protein